MQDERLKKLKALADRGIGGEKENARALLEKLCRKYGISPEDLNDEDAKELRWFRHKRGSYYEKLMGQCIFKATGKGVPKYTRRKPGSKVHSSEIGVECTASQGVEIELDYSFFSAHLDQEMDLLYQMFVQKNNLFPPDLESSGDCKVTEEEIRMYQALTRKTRSPLIGKGDPDG